MITHNFDPVMFDFGFLEIRWYSMAYILGILIGWLYAKKIINHIKEKHNFLSINKQDFDELIIYLLFGIIIGGRLGYVFFYDFSFYYNNFYEILKLWKGGMSFHGALLGITLATMIFGAIKKINFFKFTDIIVCVAPIGIFLGRIANFINGELYGKSSNLPWAVIFPHVDNIPRHPSQIYEALLEGIVLFIIINFIALKKNLIFRVGKVSALFLIFYSILRIICEIFREPDEQLGYIFNVISMGTLLSLLTLLIGLLIMVPLKK